MTKRLFTPMSMLFSFIVMTIVIVALILFQEQATLTNTLNENIASRRAAYKLEECLTDLIELENHDVRTVSVLHERIGVLNQDMEKVADQMLEQKSLIQIKEGFHDYQRLWHSLPPITDPAYNPARRSATLFLQTRVLQPCEDFKFYNVKRIEDSTTQHDRMLRQLAWGLAIVAGLGGMAGTLLGYTTARRMAHSMHRLRVQIQSASGKLAPESPQIIIEGEGSFETLQSEMVGLTKRVERMMQAYHEREREIIRAEQLAAVGQLAAGIGHEIRNPLTAIKVLADTCVEEECRPTIDETRMIAIEARRLDATLQTFLDFARPSKTERREVNIVEIIRTVIDLLEPRAVKQKTQFIWRPPIHPMVLNADGQQIKQVLINLGLNALDAMPQGGQLRIDIEGTSEVVLISISDDGSGIPEADLPHIFEPFYSTKEAGLGLGLAISRRIVENHCGTILASNGMDRGATFTLTLPVTRHNGVYYRGDNITG